MDDFELLDAWRGGDTRAGNELFNRHFDAVCRFFANKAQHEVEDLVQNTFLALVESTPKYRHEGAFRGFVFGVARNILKRHYRNKKRHRERFDMLERSVADFGPGPQSLILEQREQQLLLQALRNIPMDHQTLLELYYWEALSARELAEIFEVPEGTIRGRIRRAKQLLEEQIAALSTDTSLIETTVANLEDWARSLRARLDRDGVDPQDSPEDN